ncbi:hypothetical protein C0992_007488 [Termitomyces sp. T32_za158]|nr:hypothetical protein C0992_007488 [Termitomyces sp. T32_za158]
MSLRLGSIQCDDGANILFSKMKGATKTTDELKHFWNERAVIEEQYAKSLAALAKLPLGGEEIGDLRNSIDALRRETENQAAYHNQLASVVRSALGNPTSSMHAKQVDHRRTAQAAVEKKFKAKQTQESYVAKAKEKYDADCRRIQSYTQQCASAQGKDLERAQMKLHRAQQTVHANEMDFEHFTQGLLDMMPGWEEDWKDFCDSCQDLEEDRLEFMKDTLWTYANEVSTLCVNDDMSCENIRTVLDQLEAERDIENFVVKYGTGNIISDPAAFVPFRDGIAPPEPRLVKRPAMFTRVTRRAVPPYPINADANVPQHPPSPTESSANKAIWAQEPTQPPVATQPLFQSHQRNINNSPPRPNGIAGAPPDIDPPSPPPQAPPPTQGNSNRVSAPLPTPVNHSSEEQPPIPTPPQATEATETGGILFYGKIHRDQGGS